MEAAPVLSTPAEHIFEEPVPAAVPSSEARLDDEQLYLQYEVQRTVREIRIGRWRRIAMQFPDEMLPDAPRVFDRIRHELRRERKGKGKQPEVVEQVDGTLPRGSWGKDVTEQLGRVGLGGNADAVECHGSDEEERLYILGDTSYGACCVDEVAAEHVDADVVVHYGRACLSPTARLPVIYVFTTKPLDLDTTVASFKETYRDLGEKVCVMADIPYSHHVPAVYSRIREAGYRSVFATEVVRDPSSLLPNRTVPEDVKEDASALKEYSIFHISSPPSSLLLILASRVKRIDIHIYTADQQLPSIGPPPAMWTDTPQLLRRRYALLTRLSTVGIFGILVNTLSVSNYMAALQHCQDLIARAGKKSYVFVVGKVNAAKIANFSEIGGWVVIGCWESSLIDSKDFYRPIITPFELEVALKGDEERMWGDEWIGDFTALLGRELERDGDLQENTRSESQLNGSGDKNPWDDVPSDDEPPEFDLRTGRYVSRSRPLGRTAPSAAIASPDPSSPTTSEPNTSVKLTSALMNRSHHKSGVAVINDAVSPAAEYLRSERTWKGLGSDLEIAYERDENGNIRGAPMEQGRSGVARGYQVGDEGTKS